MKLSKAQTDLLEAIAKTGDKGCYVFSGRSSIDAVLEARPGRDSTLARVDTKRALVSKGLIECRTLKGKYRLTVLGRAVVSPDGASQESAQAHAARLAEQALEASELYFAPSIRDDMKKMLVRMFDAGRAFAEESR